MFNFFKKKEATTKVIDKIVISEAGKFQAMFNEWSKNKNIAFIFWFDDTLSAAQSFFAKQTIAQVDLFSSREATTPQLMGSTIMFGEHYPLRSKEDALYKKLNLTTVQVFSSLNETLFQKFGGEKITDLMHKLGMKDDAVIEHKMISKAIQNAQDKIEEKVSADQNARSQADWLQRNFIV